MSRVFLMKWYHFSVEYFEDLRNVNHCEFLIMRKSNDSGKYILENQLRTWSQLKQERLAIATAAKTSSSTTENGQASEKDKEKESRLLGAGRSPAGSSSPIPTHKRWGGCPNGCDHGKYYYKKENSMHAMQLNGRPIVSTSTSEPIAARRPAARRWQSSSDEDEDDPRGKPGPPELDVQKSLEESVSSPDGTPSFISIEDRLRNRLRSPHDLLGVRHGGRDGGGSASGANSDAEFSAEEDARKRLAKGKNVNNGLGISVSSRKLTREESDGMGKGVKANALGDQSEDGDDDAGGQSDEGGEPSPELLEITEAETLDKSIKGSVY